jgi:hypothetical protein
MVTLAFDVGIKNLAYCESDADGQILRWDVLTVEGKQLSDQSASLMSMLFDLFSDRDYANVLIENQPVMKNPTMKSIQMMIYSFFVIAKQIGCQEVTNIRLVSASTKNRRCGTILGGTADTSYKSNKLRAIAATRRMITDGPNAIWLSKFESSKKRDDLADAYLMTLEESTCS